MSRPARATGSQPAGSPKHSGAEQADARDRAFGLLLLCFFVSGFSALVYQTAWLREFSLVFGTSELAVATVLAAYMGGLAAGAALAAKLADRIVRPVRAYAGLEAGIAVSALCVPLLLGAAGAVYAMLLGGRAELPDAWQIGQPVFYLLAGFIVLALPTVLMGATLPLLVRHVVRADDDVGPRVGWLYSVNTLGAVVGTLAAAFVLLPRFGLAATVWAGVAGNAAAFLIAAAIARSAAPAGPSPAAESAAAESAPATGTSAAAVVFHPGRQWILPLMLLSGAVAFHYEVLYTRLLSHVLGSSIYAFATMLAAFLAGIALGGAAGGQVATRASRSATAFVLTQLAIGVASVAAYTSLQLFVPESREPVALAAWAFAVLLPATTCIGATFPLAVRILVGDEREAGTATARVYGWNTAGAIAGSVLAAFWLIPALGFGGSMTLAVAASAGLALLAAARLPTVWPRLVPISAVLAAAALLAYHPGRPVAVVTNAAFDLPAVRGGAERFFSVGRSATVLMTESDGFFELRTNGLPEASILPVGAAPVGQTQQWLVALPLIARPDAERLLLVGLGGGVALENLPASVREVDVVELEPEVTAANRAIADRRLTDPLRDDRVRIVHNDARNALRLSDKRFDVIVSQPSHPWTAGASHLFTREFFAAAHDHLQADGVFLQWMSSAFIDAELLRSLAATLADVFTHVRLYEPEPSVLLFLASDGALNPAAGLAESGRPIAGDPLWFGNMRLNGPADLMAALLLDEAGVVGFAAGAALSTDDRNLMATASRARADGLSGEALDALLARWDPLAAPGRLPPALAAAIDWTYVGSRLVADGRLDRAERLRTAVADPADAELIAGLIFGARGLIREAADAFRAALEADPANQTARFALIEPRLAALATGVASPEAARIASGLRGSARAVVDGWRLAFEEDWQGLAELDLSLARAMPTDLWFPASARLRADWRTKVAGDGAFDAALTATRIIDRALAVQPDLDLLVLRAAAADLMNDADRFVESARYAANLVSEQLDSVADGAPAPTPAQLDSMFRRLLAMRVRLLDLDVPAERTAALADRIRDQQVRIQALLR